VKRLGASHCLLAALLLVACGRDRRVYLGRDRPDAEALATTSIEPTASSEPSRNVTKPPDLGGNLDAAARPPAVDAAPPRPACAANRADCDGDPANGCEAELLTSASNCGACGTGCTSPDCACENGQRVLHCPAGRMDCDHDLANGCEIAVDTDRANCGACSRTCSATAPNTLSTRCSAGTCVLSCKTTLLTPFADCDGNPDNGCEAALWDDPKNCGRCTTNCKVCSDGECL
jgi:hypothetical protein